MAGREDLEAPAGAPAGPAGSPEDLPQDDRPEDGPTRLTAWIRGRVQGVGFRWWVRSHALALALTGYAENLADGRVKVVAEGETDACGELLNLLGGGDTPGQVTQVTHRWDTPRGGLAGFAER